jgi:hypothetical protein
MCQHLLIIAEDLSDHAIARCEHGMYHLLWDRATFTLSLAGLLELLQTAERLCEETVTRLCAWRSPGLRRLADGRLYAEVWLHKAGLRLDLDDLTLLRALLLDAVGWSAPFTVEGHMRLIQQAARPEIASPQPLWRYLN